MQCRPQLQHGDTGGRQEPKVAVWGLLGGALRVTGISGAVAPPQRLGHRQCPARGSLSTLSGGLWAANVGPCTVVTGGCLHCDLRFPHSGQYCQWQGASAMLAAGTSRDGSRLSSV